MPHRQFAHRTGTLAFRFVIVLLGVSPWLSLRAQEPGVFTQEPSIPEFQVRAGDGDAGEGAESDEGAGAARKKQDLTKDGPAPRWIWGKTPVGGRDRYFLKTEFLGGAGAAQLVATCDNRLTVWINGKRAISGDDWNSPVRADVLKFIQEGRNELVVEAINEGSAAGMLLKLAMEMPDGRKTYAVTGPSWLAAENRDSGPWNPAVVIADYGAGSWGDVLTNAGSGLSAGGPRNVFNLLPGFQVELLYLYPADGSELNRELCRVLAYLNSPTVIDKTLAMMKDESSAPVENLTELLSRNTGYGRTIALMHANHPELQKIHYAYALRTMKYGWTLQQRQEFFAWFDAARKRSGGASYEGFIDNIRNEAWANVSPEEREAMSASAPPSVISVDELPKPKGPGQPWNLENLAKMADGSLSGRDMPADLLNSLNRDEVLDLLAYVLSRGNSRDSMFISK
jgi:hypothetical protein